MNNHDITRYKEMELTKEIHKYMDRSVLCWLATASKDNIPNVSPKEIFTSYETDKIIIANIASPNSVRNIRQNPNVCVSFIDILVQKGFQLMGKAVISKKGDADFDTMEKILTVLTGGKFPFANIIRITVDTAKPILAPRYLIYPETTEKEQIESAKALYGL